MDYKIVLCNSDRIFQSMVQSSTNFYFVWITAIINNVSNTRHRFNYTIFVVDKRFRCLFFSCNFKLKHQKQEYIYMYLYTNNNNNILYMYVPSIGTNSKHRQLKSNGENGS